MTIAYHVLNGLLDVEQEKLAIDVRSRRLRMGNCPCCTRILSLTFHHLIPKKVHRRRRFSRRYDCNTLNQGIYICQDCHRYIHETYDEMQLANDYNVPEALTNDPVLQRHFRWLARQRRHYA